MPSVICPITGQVFRVEFLLGTQLKKTRDEAFVPRIFFSGSIPPALMLGKEF